MLIRRLARATASRVLMLRYAPRRATPGGSHCGIRYYCRPWRHRLNTGTMLPTPAIGVAPGTAKRRGARPRQRPSNEAWWRAARNAQAGAWRLRTKLSAP